MTGRGKKRGRASGSAENPFQPQSDGVQAEGSGGILTRRQLAAQQAAGGAAPAAEASVESATKRAKHGQQHIAQHQQTNGAGHHHVAVAANTFKGRVTHVRSEMDETMKKFKLAFASTVLHTQTKITNEKIYEVDDQTLRFHGAVQQLAHRVQQLWLHCACLLSKLNPRVQRRTL